MSAKKEITKDATPVMQDRIRRFSEELSGVWEGWQCVDSDVHVDGVLVAELLGKLGSRLVLVHHLVGSKEEVVMGALKRVSRAGADARCLARKYAAGVDVAPLVVVITEGKTKGLLKRLEALCPDPLTLFAERRLSSAGGRARFLEELTPLGEVGVRSETPVEVVEEQGKEAAQAFPAWDEVVERVDRIDSMLERTGGENEMRWTYAEEDLCCIAFDLDGNLVGRIGTDGVQHTLGTGRALEVFLDWVLARHLELVEAGKDEGLRSVELMPHPSEPLLTPEEVAAFLE